MTITVTPLKEIRKGDLVSVNVDSDANFYIEVDDFSNDLVRGLLIAIGPIPLHKYEQWSVGSFVEFPASLIIATVKQSKV